MGGLHASILAGIVLSLASRSFAAVRISAFFNNRLLPGDQGSTDGSYELLSSTFSLGQAVTKTAGGYQVGKPTAGAVVLTKRGDQWDPNFEFIALTPGSASNPRLDKVLISTATISGGAKPVPVFDVQLNDAYITSNQCSMTTGDVESYSISVVYQAITVTYYKYDATGRQTGKTQITYNVVQNRASLA